MAHQASCTECRMRRERLIRPAMADTRHYETDSAPDHRPVIDAGASEFPGGKHADRPFLTTNLINTGITRHHGTKHLTFTHFSRITAGNGKVAERASPRWLAFSITTQLKVLSPSMPASIATQNQPQEVNGGHWLPYFVRQRAFPHCQRAVPVHRSRRQRMQYGRILRRRSREMPAEWPEF